MERINKTQHLLTQHEFLEARDDAIQKAMAENNIAAVLRIDQATDLVIWAYVYGDGVEFTWNEKSSLLMIKTEKDFATFRVWGGTLPEPNL